MEFNIQLSRLYSWTLLKELRKEVQDFRLEGIHYRNSKNYFPKIFFPKIYLNYYIKYRQPLEPVSGPGPKKLRTWIPQKNSYRVKVVFIFMQNKEILSWTRVQVRK